MNTLSTVQSAAPQPPEGHPLSATKCQQLKRNLSEGIVIRHQLFSRARKRFEFAQIHACAGSLATVPTASMQHFVYVCVTLHLRAKDCFRSPSVCILSTLGTWEAAGPPCTPLPRSLTMSALCGKYTLGNGYLPSTNQEMHVCQAHTR